MKAAALFGGTFNPIHLGHLRAAEEIRAGFHLDCIYFVPSALPPHKGTDELAPAPDRWHMITEAVAANPDFIASDVEIRRKGRSYTIDTIHYFRSSLSEQTTFYLIVGIDAFLEIDTWKAYNDLFEMVPFIVMSRPGNGGGSLSGREKKIGAYLHSHVDAGYQYAKDRGGFFHQRKKPVFLYDVTQLDISSTRIRYLIKAGASIKYLVPDVIEHYILEKGLYANDQ